ncbi:MAG: type II toxin-antitoxin system RelE/ParE family toxin [Candidatus Woesearchaeota archaeon]|nr:type II toxin-antitoxin system RelE/ParE family toxin [Candidatus Woesearchaeota archaeon]
MMFSLVLSSHTQRFLKKTPGRVRLLARIRMLRDDPFPSDMKRVVQRKEKTFRIRVGQYRVLYVVDHERQEVLIADIDKRSRVY